MGLQNGVVWLVSGQSISIQSTEYGTAHSAHSSQLTAHSAAQRWLTAQQSSLYKRMYVSHAYKHFIRSGVFKCNSSSHDLFDLLYLNRTMYIYYYYNFYLYIASLYHPYLNALISQVESNSVRKVVVAFERLSHYF